jgi:hypothetical protein
MGFILAESGGLLLGEDDTYLLTEGTTAASRGTLQVTGTTSNFGAYTAVTNLVVGQVYTASLYVWPVSPTIGINVNLHDIQIVLNPGVLNGAVSSTAIGSSIPPGTASSVVMNSWNGSLPLWYRPSLTFTATESTVNIGAWAIPATGITFTSGQFDIMQVMVSPGDNVLPYGDGYSTGWNWQTAGPPGDSPSYYYQRMNVASQAIIQVLNQHVPLGQYAYQPLYYTQVTGYS